MFAAAHDFTSRGRVYRIPARSLRNVANRILIADFPTFMCWLVILFWHGFRAFFVRMREGSEYAVVDSHASVQILLLGMLFCVTLWLWQKTQFFARTRHTSLRLLLLYYLICGTSALWSADPMYSAYRALEISVVIVAICLAVRRYPDFLSAERIALQLGLILLLLRFASRVLYFAQGDQRLTVFHVNGFASASMILLLYCLGELPTAQGNRRAMLRLIGVISGAFLILGTGTSSFIAAIPAILLIALYRRRSVLGPLLLSMVFWLVLALCGFGLFFLNTAFYGKDAHDIMTFTGRLNLWQGYIDAFRLSPLWGHGFAVIERHGAEYGTFYATNTHNSFFSAALSAGAIGLFLFFLWIIRMLRESFHNLRAQRTGSLGFLAAAVATVVNCCTLPIIGGSWDESSTFFVLIMALHAVSRTERAGKNLRSKIVIRQRYCGLSTVPR